jgi:hypothetical protein
MSVIFKTKDFDLGNSPCISWDIEGELYGIVFSTEDTIHALIDVLRLIADRMSEGKPGLVVTPMAYDNHYKCKYEDEDDMDQKV